MSMSFVEVSIAMRREGGRDLEHTPSGTASGDFVGVFVLGDLRLLLVVAGGQD